MFRKPTVFVLGAGASWHYGYPTGEELVRRVIDKAKDLAKYFRLSADRANGNFPAFVLRNEPNNRATTIGSWVKAEKEALALSARLSQVNPTLIDYFLAHNSDLHDIGRLAIALVIFECEFEYRRHNGNINRLTSYTRRMDQGIAQPTQHLKAAAFDDDWLRFVIYKITAGCKSSEDLLGNKVQFVTFNYDTSLEQRIYSGLSNILFFDTSHVDAFMWKDRVFHMYGRVRETFSRDWRPENIDIPTTQSMDVIEASRALDIAYAASIGIRTIDGDDKIKDAEVISKAKAAIKAAETAYILGFGFDASNLERSGLDKITPSRDLSREIFFTNFDGHNRVGIAAGRALLNIPGAFVQPGGKSVQTLDSNGRSFRYQMSTKNVYDAFAQDFESLEMS